MTTTIGSPKDVPPSEIEARSLAVIDRETPEPRPFVGAQWEIVRRMIHTSADFELLDLVRFHPLAVDAGLSALRSGCAVITDTEMARSGIPLRRMEPLGCSVHCFMSHERTVELAGQNQTTRARAAVDAALEILGDAARTGAIFTIGNAPTALLRLLELVNRGEIVPGLIVGMPVGFVNAAESKELLLTHQSPYITIRGRKGGSPLAATCVNALAEIAAR